MDSKAKEIQDAFNRVNKSTEDSYYEVKYSYIKKYFIVTASFMLITHHKTISINFLDCPEIKDEDVSYWIDVIKNHTLELEKGIYK